MSIETLIEALRHIPEGRLTEDVREKLIPLIRECWILKIAHAPSPKNLSKNGFCPRKGSAFLRKAFLQKKISGAGEDCAVGAYVQLQSRACAEAFKEPSASQ